MKKLKRLLAMLLAVMMIIGLVPTSAMQVDAESTLVASAIFCSDVHNTTSDVSSVFAGIAKSGKTYTTATFCGDTFSDNSGSKSTVTSAAQNALGDTSVKCFYSWGDHDSKSDIEEFTGLLYGGTDTAYYIYAISMDSMDNDADISAADVAADIAAFTSNVASYDHTKPLFIASHMPLHVRRNDNIYAYDWYQAISEAAKTMDIVFFWAHNHTSESSVDTNAYYVEKNGSETITVETGTNSDVTVTPNFTYMNAGYINANNQDPARKGVATTVDIYTDKMVFQDYNSSGTYTGTYAHNVEVARAFASTDSSTDTTVTETSKTLSSIAITTLPSKTTYTVGSERIDTTGMVVTATYNVVYSDGSIGTKTETVTGYEVSSVDLTTVGTKEVTVSYTEGEVTKTATFNITVVEASDSGSDDSETDNITLDWKEIPGSTTYTYGLVTSYTPGQSYLIVAANNAVAMWNNNGSLTTFDDFEIDGTTLTSTTDLSGSMWTISSDGVISNGSYSLYRNQNSLSLSTRNQTQWTVTTGETHRFSNKGGSKTYYLRYNNSYDNPSFGVSTSSSNSVRLYGFKSSSSTTAGYAAIAGDTTYTVLTGTDVDTAMAAVLAGITGYHTTDVNSTNPTVLDDADLTFEWVDTYDADTVGSYTVKISYDGQELGTVEVKVQDKKVANMTASDDTGNVTINALGTATTGTVLTVTYEDGTTATVPVTVDMLTDANGKAVSTTAIGKFESITITYGGFTIDEYTLIVNPVEGNNYPEYPDQGAVLVNKTGDSSNTDFTATGITKVELSTTGVPYVSTGIDVVLMLDMTGSMSDDGMEAAEEAAKAFVKTIVVNEDGTYNANRVAVYAFNSGSSSPYELVSLKSITSDAELSTANTAIETASTKQTSGGTPYNEALEKCYNVLQAAKVDGTGNNRQQFCVFMSDGGPTDYYADDGDGTYTHVYGGNSSGDKNITSYISGYNSSSSSNWSYSLPTEYYSNLMKADGVTIYTVGLMLQTAPSNPSPYSSMTDSTYDSTTDTLTTIGSHYYFCSSILKPIASDEDKYIDIFNVDNADDATAKFTAIAAGIKEAATNAYFVDAMGKDFDLQLSTSNYTVVTDASTNKTENKTLTPTIQVTEYVVYKNADVGTTVNNVTITKAMVGTRTGASTVRETVTFNATGTEAYSNQIGNGATNILVDGVICAKYFWYNTNATSVMIDTNGDGTTDYELAAETFYWSIGTVSETEWALSYYVYLTGSREGTRDAGSYDTNESAVLYYTNYLGNPCYQETVSPKVAWKAATVSYAFYLVDENGNPVTNTTTGAIGSFVNSVKLTSPEVYETVYLNSIANISSTEVVAYDVLPEGYELYDTAAKYTLSVNSNGTGSWVIVNGTTPDTTYVAEYGGDPTTLKEASTTTYDYTHTVVWFAVKYVISAVPDTVVIDYGLPVDISVLGNDIFGDNGKLVGVGANSTDLTKTETLDTAVYGDSYTATYGTAAVNGSEVRYTPANMQMNSYDRFSYAVKYSGVDTSNTEYTNYFYSTVTVIPATTIYYEDSFVDFSSYTWDYDTNAWAEVSSKWVPEGTTLSDATQAEDRPGEYSLPKVDANNVYGYDGAYTECSKYSLGSAMKTTVDYDNYGQADFTFYGTGFDLISLTSNKTGTILVYVYDASGTKVRNHIVDTYYGYTYDEETEEWVTSVNDPNALYQVPVIEVAGLPYGKYSVEVLAIYDPAFDHNQYTEDIYDFYFDSVRIYDPANDGASNEVIQDAYESDKEAWPVYEELRNNVIDAAVLDGSTAELAGIVFIDSDDETASVSDYLSYGPNNELYLAPGQAIAFSLDLSGYVDASGNSIVDTVQLGVKTVGGNAASYKLFDAKTVSNTEDLASVTTVEVQTATGMYYDMSSLKNSTIVIYNAGTSGTLSLTDIKITFTQNPGEVETFFVVSADVIKKIVESMNTVPVKTFTPASMSISTSPTKVYAGNTITVKVTTSTDVAGISVNDTLVTSYATNSSGNKVWTAKVPTSEAGTKTINVIAYDVNGVASTATVKTVTVNTVSDWGSAIGSTLNTLFDWLFK